MNQRTTQRGELMSLTVVCLLLTMRAIIIVAESSENSSEVKPFAEYDLSLTKDHPTMRLDTKYADDGIVATKQVSEHLGQKGFWIKLIGPEPNSTTNECFQAFHIASKHSIIRLSNRTILMETLPIDANTRARRKLMLLNLKNCNYTFVYEAPLSRDYKIFTSDNASDESFTLIMNGKQYCRGHNWCRLLFNPIYQKFEPLNFDFPFMGSYKLTPVGSFDGNLLAVEHLDETTNTYKIRLYNVSANSAPSDNTELLSLANFISFPYGWSRIELISSALSYCWRTSQDTLQDKTVHCLAFRQDGTVLVNQSIVFSNLFKFYKVQHIANGLILIGKRECSNDAKCSDLQSTTITNDSCINSDCNSEPQANELITVRHRYYNFKCRASFVSQIHLRVNLSIDPAKVDYMCIYMARTQDASSHTYVL